MPNFNYDIYFKPISQFFTTILRRRKYDLNILPVDRQSVVVLGENQLIGIIPTFSSNVIHLVSGDVGPFRASLPVNVPLWMAINLKQQRKCKIQPPEWMNIELLEEVKENERLSRTFTKMPSDHYMVEAKLLLQYAWDDISRADEIRTIIKDIWDIRMSKIRSSVDTLVKKGGSFASVDYLTMMEINSMRPLLPHAMDQVHRMKKGQGQSNLQTQNNSFSLNLSNANNLSILS